MKTEYQQLISKLDRFIRKYYKNQMIRGILLSLIIYVLAYIIMSLSEFYGQFSIPVRTTVFYLFIASFLGVFVGFIVVPALRFLHIGRIISHKQAATIITTHFKDIQDKLLNTLELASLKNTSGYSPQLIDASIEQRIKMIKPIPFESAINIRNNVKYLKYLLPLLLLFFLLYKISPNIFTESTSRIIKHRTYFAPKAPFRFLLANDSLSIEKGGDFSVKLKIKGEYVPSEVYIQYGGNTFLMNQSDSNKSEFTYNFKNINNAIDFQFAAQTYTSQTYSLKVLPAPVILDFRLTVNVPAYTNENDQVLDNVGDVTVPYGSSLKWRFHTLDSDSLYLTFNDSLTFTAKKDSAGFSYSKSMYRNTQYAISLLNRFFKRDKLMNYNVNVIPDLYPSIEVTAMQDSINHTLYYFKGNINDDYGFTKLAFHYKKDENSNEKSVPIPFNPNVSNQEFYYVFDFSSLGLSSGKGVEYYFRISDNDAINGAKSSRTQTFAYSIPTQKEISAMEEEANEKIQSKLDEAKKLTSKLVEEIKELQQSAIDKSKTAWEQQKMLRNIADKQKELENLVQQINQQNAEKNNLTNSFNEQQEKLFEKQQKIQELMEELLSDELKELLEEIQKLQEEFDEKKLHELSDELEFSYKDMAEQLDRNLEMLKRYEVEERVNDIAKQMDELAKEHEELAEETGNRKSDSEELKQKQQEHNDEFDRLMEEYKQTLEKNKELEKPMGLENFEQEKKNIEQQMQNSQEQLQNQKKRKASDSQQKSSQMMKKMAQNMQQMMQQISMSATMENMDNLRQILNNLITFSFDQEKLMSDLGGVNSRDPQYVEMMNTQKKLSDNFELVKDSLHALAKRTPAISTPVYKETKSITKNIDKTLDLLENRRSSTAQRQQQFIMTSANNLALLLSEVLEAMQNQMANAMPGEQQAQKSSNAPGLKKMREQQQSLKQQMQNLLKQMKEGKSTMSKKALNKRLAKMLAQQEMFQKMMRDLKKKGSLLPETQKLMDEIRDLLEKNEEDLVNYRINTNTIKRQNDIVTRLLDAENAEREREFDKKRKSTEAEQKMRKSPEEIFKDKEKNPAFKESLRSVKLKLNNFYKNKYSDYINELNKE